MKQHKRIFIVGHPGAGKALLAKSLAEKLNWQFVNADFEMEFRTGRMLVEFLGEPGVDAFAHGQSKILNSLFEIENIVVTTDAGIVCDEKNRELLLSEFVVNLKVSIPVQMERISRHPDTLFPVESFEEFLAELHQERDSLYEQVASLTIDSDDNALEEHVLNVMEILDGENINQTSDQLAPDKKDLIFFHKTLHRPVKLSEQQAVCLKLLAEGKSSKEIARDMNISYRTVEGYVAKITELLGCLSSKELVALYHDQP